MSGEEERDANCFSIDSPPLIPMNLKDLSGVERKAPRVLNTLSVWTDSSRVGDKITANADFEESLLPPPTLPRDANNFSRMGMRKATVLPEPVRAMTTASTPVRRMGSDLRCTGVGLRYPSFFIPEKIGGERFRDWKPPPVEVLFSLDFSVMMDAVLYSSAL